VRFLVLGDVLAAATSFTAVNAYDAAVAAARTPRWSSRPTTLSECSAS
jgi:hypothetical protein